jgi:hypothetical protein
MDEQSVYAWTLKGCLRVWHYLPPVKGLEGWHLNADAIACTSLVDLIDRMLKAEERTQMHIPICVPSRMLVAPGHPWKSMAELLLVSPKGDVGDEFWHLELVERNVLKLTVGTAKLREFSQSLLDLPQWKDDFALGPTVSTNNRSVQRQWASECLWFWTKVE